MPAAIPPVSAIRVTPKRCEARGDRVDVPGSEAHELAGRNVVAHGVFQYGGRQLGKVARMRLAHPAHDRMRIATEAARTEFPREPLQAILPSCAHSTRRAASQPSQAPLPSSEMGKPQPPMRCSCPSTTAQPTLPVPTMMMPPGAAAMGADARGMRVGG